MVGIVYSLFVLGPSAARIVAYQDGLPPSGVLRDRQAMVNALPALHLPLHQ